MPAVTVAEDARAPLALALDRRSHLHKCYKCLRHRAEASERYSLD